MVLSGSQNHGILPPAEIAPQKSINHMLVSVGIPTYNRPLELMRALNSIINQTHRGLDIIISNNGSTDHRVSDVISKYLTADARIRYFSQDPPLRVIKNFQFVLDKAQGEYFLWLADDDWLDEEYIAKCVDMLRADDTIGLACGRCLYHNRDGTILEHDSSVSITSRSGFRRVFKYYANVTRNGYYYGLMRTAVAQQISLNERVGFDWLFIASLLFVGKAVVLESVANHITTGGISANLETLLGSTSDQNNWKKYFVGLTLAANAARDVFQSSVYHVPRWLKYVYSILFGVAAYSNTIRWDFYLNLDRFLRRVSGYKH
jgi:glycosyltransferase involved in cell wall biosynthesis